MLKIQVTPMNHSWDLSLEISADRTFVVGVDRLEVEDPFRVEVHSARDIDRVCMGRVSRLTQGFRPARVAGDLQELREKVARSRQSLPEENSNGTVSLRRRHILDEIRVAVASLSLCEKYLNLIQNQA